MTPTRDAARHWNVAAMDYFDLEFWFAHAVGEEVEWMQDPSCRSVDPVTGDQAECLIRVRIVEVKGTRCWEHLPNYCDDWALVGPHIGDIDIELAAVETDPHRPRVTKWRAQAAGRPEGARHPHTDRLQLAAAMRCFVACRYGDTFKSDADGLVDHIDVDDEGYPLYE